MVLPPSSIAKLNNKYEPPEMVHARKKQQQWELRQVLEHQMRDNREKEESLIAHDHAYAAAEKESNMLRTHVEQEQLRLAREDEKDTVRFNSGLSKTNAKRAERHAGQKAAEEQAELDFQMTSPMLSEEVACQYGLNGQILPKTFKRMDREQRQAILDEQAYQMVEGRERRRMENYETELFAQQLERQRLCLETVEAARNDRRMQKERDFATGHLEDIRAARALKADLDDVYANKIGSDFYAQFGTRAR